jgi:hypothetical protein
MSLNLVRTKNLNQAAFLSSLGAEFLDVEDKYPDNTFVLRASPFHLFLEKSLGYILYKKFCNQRLRLKRFGRKKAGLPEKFVGNKDEGFLLQDVARVRSFNKREQSVVDKL